MATQFYPKHQAEMEFLALTGEERKKRGMRKAASRHHGELLYIQNLARITARRKGVISVDDVREAAERDGHVWSLQNATGSIFKGHDWEWCGLAKSKRPEAHARIVRTWRLK